MLINPAAPPRTHTPAVSPAYARALDGLRGFDAIDAALRERQDTIQRSIDAALGSYAKPAAAASASAGAALGNAVAAYANSEAGRTMFERIAHAAMSFCKGVFRPPEPEQLAFPLERTLPEGRP